MGVGVGGWGGILTELLGSRVSESATAGQILSSNVSGAVVEGEDPLLQPRRQIQHLLLPRPLSLQTFSCAGCTDVTYPKAGLFPSLAFCQFFCSSLEKLVKLVCGVPPSSWALGHCGVTLAKPTRWVRRHTAFAP